MLSPLLLQIQFFIFFNSLPKSPFDKIQPFAESSIFLTPPAPRKHIFSPTKQKTHEHINQKSPKLFDLAGFPGEQTDCLHMRGDGTRILHGKSYHSKLSPPFAGEYKTHLFYPTRQFSPF